jgi:YD repeat-containing protein
LTYDAYGRVLTAIDPVGTVTQYTYDAAENLLAVTADAGPGRLNLTTAYTYDTTGNLTAFRACVQHTIGVGSQDGLKGTVSAPFRTRCPAPARARLRAP